MTLTRACVVVHGRVQGVWFRGSLKSFAASKSVNGWVRNRLDGTVEALFEGIEEDVRAVVAWCGKGPSGARVERVEVKWLPHEGEFDRMTIVPSL